MRWEILFLVVFLATFLGKKALAQGSAPDALSDEVPSIRELAKWPPPRFVLGDTEHRLRIEWVTQLRGEVTSRGDAEGASVGVRRMRVRFRGEIARNLVRPFLQLDLGPNRGAELLDLMVDIRLAETWHLRFGQWKVPFTRWRTNSFARQAAVEWAPVLLWFGSERQLGFALHNGSERAPEGLDLEGGVFTGTNARPTHGNGVAIVSGEPVPGHSSLAGRNEAPRIHPELVMRLGWNAPGAAMHEEFDRERSQSFRPAVHLSFAWDLRADPWRDFAMRIAPEVWMKYAGFSLLGIGFWGLRARPPSPHALSGPFDLGGLAAQGLLAQLAYRFEAELGLALRVSWVWVDVGFAEEAKKRAEEQIAAHADNPSVAERYQNAGRLLEEGEILGAFVWDLWPGVCRLGLDLAFLFWRRESGTEEGLRGRMQFQLAL
ncbi:MAG: porin [Sandaracinaceae bacterium]|nr:porin [Sandaracinaceae bacterium]